MSDASGSRAATPTVMDGDVSFHTVFAQSEVGLDLALERPSSRVPRLLDTWLDGVVVGAVTKDPELVSPEVSGAAASQLGAELSDADDDQLSLHSSGDFGSFEPPPTSSPGFVDALSRGRATRKEPLENSG